MQGGRWGLLGGCGALLRNLNWSEKQWELSGSLKQSSAVVVFERPRQRLFLWREQHGELMETVEGNTVGT